MNNELKPCPFCGNNRVRLRTHNYGHGITIYTVRCKTKGNKCLIKPVTQAYSTKEQAIKAWNTRPDIEKQEREKGCEYCNIGEHKDTLYQISTIGNPTFKLFEPNYCPICGRKLGEK